MEEGASRPGLPRMWVRHVGWMPATSAPSCSVLGEQGERQAYTVCLSLARLPQGTTPGRGGVCVLVMR